MIGRLYESLNELKFIQVRGTPASGKSIIASLLYKYIEHKEGRPPYWSSSWKQPQKGGPRLLANVHDGWEPNDGSVVVFDEGQNTYWDSSLWDDTFKPVASNPKGHKNRFILFCSYGSPGSATSSSTPWNIPAANRVGLRAEESTSGCGLLFNAREFDDYIKRRASLGSHKFDKGIFHWVYQLTSGHIGAMEEVLRCIEADDCYRHLGAHEKFTVDRFISDIHPHNFYQRLGRGIIFSRGLPQISNLHNIDIADVFRYVMFHGEVKPGKEAMDLCFRRGWLHAVAADDEETEVKYVFASHLHEQYIAWKMFGRWFRDCPNDFPFMDLFTFSCSAIARFSPISLVPPREVTPGVIQVIPEAAYQQEFYRACFVLTNGRVTTFPEFGTATGRADFYLPDPKWGIELLREGQKLEEHVSRFKTEGKYAKTLTLREHILLDFRTRRPTKLRYEPNLYHVVFSHPKPQTQYGLSQFEVLDSQLNVKYSESLIVDG